MPHIKTYQKGSIIFFEGNSTDKHVYLLKSGKCCRNKLDLSTNTYKKTPVQIGEFFAVKPALGISEHDENIVANSVCKVFAFTHLEFQKLLETKPDLSFKILRSFSFELRSIHRTIDTIISKKKRKADENKEKENEENFFRLSKFLLDIGKYSRAKYACKRFIAQHPASSFKNEIEEILQTASASITDKSDEE